MGSVITMAALEGTASGGLEAVGTAVAFAFEQLGKMETIVEGHPIITLVVVGLPVAGWAISRGKALFHK